MRRRSLAVAAVFAALLCAAAAWLAVAHRSRPQPEAAARKEPGAFACVRTVTAFAALAERPSARRVLLLGDMAGDYRGCFERAGLSCSAKPEGRFDIVFAAGARAPREEKAARKAMLEGAAWAECVDARDLAASGFLAKLNGVPGDVVHLWMPGERDWLLVGRPAEPRPSLGALMDLFSRDGAFEDLAAAQCASLPCLFASYVGSRDDLLPAFSGPDAPVRPDVFVTRESADFGWLDTGGVDADICGEAMREMRSMQIVRRMVIVGAMQAERGEGEKSAETWARAALRNPGDTMLVERLERLLVNAQAFDRLGKPAMAARCYETMAQIRPNDPAPVRGYGECLRKLGQEETAKLAFERADMLERGARRP